jgi:hypothetical protein
MIGMTLVTAHCNEIFKLFWTFYIVGCTYIFGKKNYALAANQTRKARSNKFHTFQQCTYTVYLYAVLTDRVCIPPPFFLHTHTHLFQYPVGFLHSIITVIICHY